MSEPAPFRILVVEDEPVIRELVRSMLHDGPVEVETAANGVEGLKRARTQTFDLILLDVVLPLMDGITVCRMLKSDPATAAVPLYMLTAKVKKSDMEAAIAAGADGYIHKPFRGAELMELVARLRESSSPGRGPRLG
jgi:two-component system phosphate regulon response regulator PhoB